MHSQPEAGTYAPFYSNPVVSRCEAPSPGKVVGLNFCFLCVLVYKVEFLRFPNGFGVCGSSLVSMGSPSPRLPPFPLC